MWLGYRVCSYIDKFSIAPSVGTSATSAVCLPVSQAIRLLLCYGLTRYALKCVWSGGAHVVEHLRFVIHTVRGTFRAYARKFEELEELASGLLSLHSHSARRVPSKVLALFIAKAQSLRLTVPETAFRIRALYDTLDEKEVNGG